MQGVERLGWPITANRTCAWGEIMTMIRHRGGVGLPCPIFKRGGGQGMLWALRVHALARQARRGHSDGGPIMLHRGC
jgi:hypothetical protein